MDWRIEGLDTTHDEGLESNHRTMSHSVCVKISQEILLRNTRFDIARVYWKEIFNKSVTMIDIIGDEMSINDRITDENSNLKP